MIDQFTNRAVTTGASSGSSSFPDRHHGIGGAGGKSSEANMSKSGRSSPTAIMEAGEVEVLVTSCKVWALSLTPVRTAWNPGRPAVFDSVVSTGDGFNVRPDSASGQVQPIFHTEPHRVGAIFVHESRRR